MAERRYRVGTTSYIVPADLMTNIEALAGRVEDVELVLFESDEVSNLPTEEEVARFGAIARSAGLSYTVHCPLDANLGALDEVERRASVGKCLRVIELTRPLSPFGYVVHFHGDLRGGKASVDPPRWQAALERSVDELLSSRVVEPDELCIETLDYPFSMVDDIIAASGLSVCLDVGHLLLYGYPLHEHLERYWDRVRIIHLHGIVDGKDHRTLEGLLPERQSELEELLTWLEGADRERVLTLEVFDESDLAGSLALLRELSGRGDLPC